MATVMDYSLTKKMKVDPYFAMSRHREQWSWAFHDENNIRRAIGVRTFCNLKNALEDVRETQKRIGNLATPILRVV